MSHIIFINNLKIYLFIFRCFIFLGVPNVEFAQNISNANKDIVSFEKQKFVKLRNADAKYAIEIQDSIEGPFNVSVGCGLYNETSAFGFGERNSAWFKFTIYHDTTLTFDIVPFDSLDDFDFVLFKCLNKNCINTNGKEIFDKIRSCFSVCSSKSGMTGLSEYATGFDILTSQGTAYASSVYVKAGEVYYLMVDFSQDYVIKGRNPSGFNIYFYNYYQKRKPIILNNIFFETGKAILQKESFTELDRLVSMLTQSQMVIEVRGHTDNVGDEKNNQLLSEDRAKAVVDYLISKQINEKRLFYKGFGSTKSIASNNTTDGRQKNRRVEFIKVLY